MTAEMKSTLQALWEDEQTDCKHYEELAQKAHDAGMYEVSGILHDISHDEHTHAKAIEHILEMEEP